MMNLNKVLEILNNGEYIKLEEKNESSDFYPRSESSYTATLKERGVIKITQVITSGILYRIELFVPSEEKCVKSWTFDKNIKDLIPRKIGEDPLYDEVSSTFYNLFRDYTKKKINEHSKYFPQ